jgi:hypothetical protein
MDTGRFTPGFRPATSPESRKPKKTQGRAIFDRDYALALIALRPGICDREMAASVYGPDSPSQMVTPVCRTLADEGAIRRRLRPDGLLGNFLRDD